MNRTIKAVPRNRFHYGSHDQLRRRRLLLGGTEHPRLSLGRSKRPSLSPLRHLARI